jgi:hypothetical protein
LAHAAVQHGSTSRRSPWLKPVDHLKNAPKQIAGHRDLHHLKSHVAPLGDMLRADLDELPPQACQRLFVDLIRQRVKSRATLTPPSKSSSALISLRKIEISRDEFHVQR